MPVLAELCIALLLGFLAVELDTASRRASRVNDRVTDRVVMLDLSLGFTTILVTVLSLRVVTGLIF